MKKWIRGLFDAVDNKDVDAFVSFLTQDASFKFANAPSVHKKENIRQAISQFFSVVKALRHNVKDVWECCGVVICEGEVAYTRHDMRQMGFPFVTIFRMKEGKIADYRIYIDSSSLFT